jgi:hypothetical protein
MTTTFATAALSDIKSFLAANAADAGLASAMKFDGWKMADVREYADRVQALREAGYTAAITPRTVAAAEQQLVADVAAEDLAWAAQAERMAAEAATAAELMAQVEAQVAAASNGSDDSRPRWQRRPSAGGVAKLAKLVEHVGAGDEVRIDVAALEACDVTVTWLSVMQAWTEEGGVWLQAAMQLGYTVVSGKRMEHVTLRRAA